MASELTRVMPDPSKYAWVDQTMSEDESLDLRSEAGTEVGVATAALLLESPLSFFYAVRTGENIAAMMERRWSALPDWVQHDIRRVVDRRCYLMHAISAEPLQTFEDYQGFAIDPVETDILFRGMSAWDTELLTWVRHWNRRGRPV
jgi:hypothetical protein